MNNLTEQEKVVKKYYDLLVLQADKLTDKEKKKHIKNFCKDLSKAALVGTSYEDNKIFVKAIDKKKNINGSMNVLGGKNKYGKFVINQRNMMKAYKLQSKNRFNAFKGFFKLVETSNHELRHFFQGKDNGQFRQSIDMISLGDALDYSYEDVARISDSDFYSTKHGNYLHVMKEGDARRTGCINACNQIFNAIPTLSRDQAKYMSDCLMSSVREDNVEYNKMRFARTTRYGSRADVSRVYTEQTMAALPKELLHRYPALRLEFLSNGTRRSVASNWNSVRKQKQAILENSNLNEDAKKEMIERLHIGYSKIFYNSFNELTDYEKKDLVRRMGLDEVNKVVSFTLKGKRLELSKREATFKKYSDVIQEKGLQEFISKTELDSVVDEYKNKAGYGLHFDFVSQDNYVGFENDETKFLDRFRSSISHYDDRPYTPEERAKADKELISIKEKRRQDYIKKYVARKDALKRKNGLFKRFLRKITNHELLDAPAEEIANEEQYTLEDLSSKRAEALKLQEEKQNSMKELEHIKEEVDLSFKKAEAKSYLEKQNNEDRSQKEMNAEDKSR